MPSSLDLSAADITPAVEEFAAKIVVFEPVEDSTATVVELAVLVRSVPILPQEPLTYCSSEAKSVLYLIIPFSGDDGLSAVVPEETFTAPVPLISASLPTTSPCLTIKSFVATDHSPLLALL